MQILAEYTYHCPQTLVEACTLYLNTDGAMIMAGGSDVMPQLKMDTICPKALIDLAKIDELKKIEEKDDGIHIGSMAVLSHIAKNELIVKKLPIISQAVRNVASPQIRNRGTIGGNVLQARRCFYYNQTKEWRSGIPVCRKVGGDVCIQIPNSPVCRAIYYSDVAPALIALNAQICVCTTSGEKQLSVEEFAAMHCEDRLEKMLIKEFVIPAESYNNAKMRFCKYALRGSIDFPIINFAYVANSNGVQFTVGAIATKVLHLESVEQYLQENRNGFDVEKAVALAEEEMKKKAQLIRESGLSVNVKRASFLQVREILGDLNLQFAK